MSDLLVKYDIDPTRTIAVCYRGTDKKTETGLPSYDGMIDKIQQIHKQYPTHKILIQTDEIGFTEYVKTKIPDFIQFGDVIKVTTDKTATQFYVEAGHKLEHAQTFLAIMYILSSCSNLIINSGNVGMWLCLFRHNTNGVSQYFKSKDSKKIDEKCWLY